MCKLKHANWYGLKSLWISGLLFVNHLILLCEEFFREFRSIYFEKLFFQSLKHAIDWHVINKTTFSVFFSQIRNKQRYFRISNWSIATRPRRSIPCSPWNNQLPRPRWSNLHHQLRSWWKWLPSRRCPHSKIFVKSLRLLNFDIVKSVQFYLKHQKKIKIYF